MAGHPSRSASASRTWRSASRTGCGAPSSWSVERLAGIGEPQYRLRPADGVALCVLAESKLGPTASAEEAGRRLDASLPAPGGSGSPWSA